MIICKKCGHENDEGSKFCNECGISLKNPNMQQERTNSDKLNLNSFNQNSTKNNNRNYTDIYSSSNQTPTYHSNEAFNMLSTKKEQKRNIIIIAVSAIAVLLFIGFAVFNIDDEKTTTKNDNTTSKSEYVLDDDPEYNNNNDDDTIYEKETTTEKKTTVKEYTTLSEAEYRSRCGYVTYDELARNPDKYKGKKAKFTGEVVQVQESIFGNVYRIAINKTSYGYGYDEILYAVMYNTERLDGRIIEDDIITIYCTLDGLETYETVQGNSLTIPKVQIEYYDLVG